jgi:hypothetical protein
MFQRAANLWVAVSVVLRRANLEGRRGAVQRGFEEKSAAEEQDRDGEEAGATSLLSSLMITAGCI